MLDRRHVAAALAERRRVVEAPRRLGDGRDEGVDVGPVEDDRRGPRGRMQDDPDVAARVQADSGEPDAPDEGVLGAHSGRDLHGGCHGGGALFQGISADRGLLRRRGVWQKPLTCGISATSPAPGPFVQNRRLISSSRPEAAVLAPDEEKYYQDFLAVLGQKWRPAKAAFYTLDPASGTFPPEGAVRLRAHATVSPSASAATTRSSITSTSTASRPSSTT